MFKNLVIYRIGQAGTPSIFEVEAALQKSRFVDCGPAQQKSTGWIEPRGEAHAPLAEVVDGQILLKLMTERRVLPGSVIKKRAEEMAAKIESETGRKPGKKQLKELKEQAIHELLPMAFTRQSATRVWIAPKEQLLMIDAGSQAKADEVVTLLVQSFPHLSMSLIQTAMSSVTAMTHWLGEAEPPYNFTIDRECELKSTDAMKSVVRYTRHNLDTDEVKQHIVSGKVPTRVAMTWRDRISFVLTESLQVKKVAFLDVVFEGAMAADKDETFDADAALATGELSQMLSDLIEALGGEQVIGQSASAEPVAALPDVASNSSSVDAPPWDA